MRRDQKLVVVFLSAYNQHHGTSYEIKRWPDAADRQKPAVEAVASDERGHTIAFEHTLVEPFEGERIDTSRFMTVFAPLERCADLLRPGFNVNVCVKVGSIPTGVDWENVAGFVRLHLAHTIPVLPEGRTLESINGMTFPIPVEIAISAHELSEPDHVWVSRYLPPDSLEEVVRRALRRKLPKLVAEEANTRILLLEQADIAHGHSDIRQAIDDLAPEFPKLKQVGEIWLAITPGWESEKVLFFYELFPDLGGRRLKTFVTVATSTN